MGVSVSCLTRGQWSLPEHRAMGLLLKGAQNLMRLGERTHSPGRGQVVGAWPVNIVHWLVPLNSPGTCVLTAYSYVGITGPSAL